MNLVPSRFACHCPRPSVCSPRSIKASCRLAAREICSAHSFPSLPNTRSARADTPLPIASSYTRSLIALRCSNFLFRRPAATRETPRGPSCDPSLSDPARPRQTRPEHIPAQEEGTRNLDAYDTTAIIGVPASAPATTWSSRLLLPTEPALDAHQAQHA